jgi:hypothetical protein
MKRRDRPGCGAPACILWDPGTGAPTVASLGRASPVWTPQGFRETRLNPPKRPMRRACACELPPSVAHPYDILNDIPWDDIRRMDCQFVPLDYLDLGSGFSA